MSVETRYSDSAATANADAKRDGSGDIEFRVVATTALGGVKNLGYSRAGVYSVSTSPVTIDNATVNGALFIITTSTSSFTLNLPAASTYTGQELEFVKLDSAVGTCAITGAGGDLINGSATFVLYSQYECLRVRSTGSAWVIISYFSGTPSDLRSKITDPGNAGAIGVARSGYVALVTAGAETRTIAAPSSIGLELLVYCKTFVGNAVVTVATTLNETGNNTITFSATGQSCLLVSVEEGSNKRWRLAQVDGCTLSTV